MPEKSSDDIWSQNLDWADCLGDPPGQLLSIPDAEHMLHMIDSNAVRDCKASDPDASDAQKETYHVPDSGDDGLEMEPPAKMHASGKLDSQAAKETKAIREKQRRAQLNNRYIELAALVDPSKPPKTDRSLILEDAVRVITQLRVENNQLRQLNKLLEERVQENEAPRGQALYQSYLMSQGGLYPARPDGASTSNRPSMAGPVEHAVDHGKGQAVAGQPPTPSADPSTLAVQMMNVAMQLLQSRGGSQQMPTNHAGLPQHMTWMQGSVAPISSIPCQPMHAPQATPRGVTSYSEHAQGVPDRTHGGNLGAGADEAKCAASAGLEDSRDPTASAVAHPPNLMEFPAQIMHPHQYIPGYSLPQVSNVAQGWPPPSLMDQARDSKLRPPAA